MGEVIVLQHHPVEKLGRIDDALASACHKAHYVRTFNGEPVPETLDSSVGLIVMGGPMGVYEQDRFPFLADELGLIERALRDGKPLLGVCLGSQMIAAVLGAEVKPGARKEIGWYEVELTADAEGDPLWSGLPSRFVAFHWHGDVFDLPAGAVGLASSKQTPHQAFRYGSNAYGFLFHMEVTADGVADMVDAFADELRQTGLDANAILTGRHEHLRALGAIADGVFSKWVHLL